MNLIIFASTVIAAIVIAIAIKKSNNSMEKERQEFFERERQANFVRKKSLDGLNYVHIPAKFLDYDYSTALDANDASGRGRDALDKLMFLADSKVVNFSGMSNTDLKLEYGTANLTILSEYDQNFTALVRSLQTLAELTSDIDKSFSIELLEYSVDIGTDMSTTYKLLIDSYSSLYGEGENFHIKKEALLEKASNLNSVMAPSIIRYIENNYNN